MTAEEIEFEKQRHAQNLEIIATEHANRMELEALRNRRAFDSIAMSDLEEILTSVDGEGIVITKRLSAIAWCHQQAALLPTNMYAWRIDESENVLKSLDITANYLFKTFFPDLAKAPE